MIIALSWLAKDALRTPKYAFSYELNLFSKIYQIYIKYTFIKFVYINDKRYFIDNFLYISNNTITFTMHFADILKSSFSTFISL